MMRTLMLAMLIMIMTINTAHRRNVEVDRHGDDDDDDDNGPD